MKDKIKRKLAMPLLIAHTSFNIHLKLFKILHFQHFDCLKTSIANENVYPLPKIGETFVFMLIR